MAVDRKDKRFFDFMCHCGDKGKERCERVYDEVMQEFKDEYESRDDRFRIDVTDKIFTHLVVMNLSSLKKGMAYIEGIDTDMWSGIAVKYQYDYNECECDLDALDVDDDCGCEEWKYQDFWIECDMIHHGLARAYQLVKEFDESLNME